MEVVLGLDKQAVQVDLVEVDVMGQEPEVLETFQS